MQPVTGHLVVLPKNAPAIIQFSCFTSGFVGLQGDFSFTKDQAFPGGSDSKDSTCNVGDLGLISGLGRSPGGRHGNPLQDSCLENPCGQRSLAGYSPWGNKELDRIERLST